MARSDDGQTFEEDANAWLNFPTKFIYNLPLSAFTKHQSTPRCWIHRYYRCQLATLGFRHWEYGKSFFGGVHERQISINVIRHHERRKKPNSGNIQNHQPPADELDATCKANRHKLKERRTTTVALPYPFGYRDRSAYLAVIAPPRRSPSPSNRPNVRSRQYLRLAIRHKKLSAHLGTCVEFTSERRVKCQAHPL